MDTTEPPLNSGEILVVLLGITFFAPLTPSLFSKSIREGGKWLSVLNCFASGVFVGIDFFHILPESFEKLTSMRELNVQSSEEFVEMLRWLTGFFILGFILMLCLDTFWFSKYHQHSHDGSSHTHQESNNLHKSHTHQPGCDHEVEMIELNTTHNTGDNAPLTKSRMVAIGTFVAFSFHSFLEGIALGSETIDMQILAFIGVFSFHKALDGLAITIALSRAFLSAKVFWICVILFACMTPVGLLSAYSLFQSGGPFTRYSGFIEGISGGVFMYIALFHILKEELESTLMINWKVAAFCFALFTMFLLENIV